MDKESTKQFLIIAFSFLDKDPRVHRQLMFLSDYDNINIISAGYTRPRFDGVEFVTIEEAKKKNIFGKIHSGILLKARLFKRYYWSNPSVKSAVSQIGNSEFDVIIANDINTLPLAVFLAEKTNAKIFLDCHEFTPREFDDQFKFSFFFKGYWNYICKTYIHYAHVTSTVCHGIADEYKKQYGGNWKVITNAPPYEHLNCSVINNDRIRVIHHGGLNPSRKMEKMIELVDHLDERFELDFMLLNSNPSYYDGLKSLAKDKPRIKFREAVPMTEIARTINKYDIGLYMLAPAGFNNKMALPNKFFEFIQARLALAVWPSPEMAKIVKKYNCGVVSEDYTVESMANALNKLTVEDIKKYKENSHTASKELCAEKNREIFLDIVRSLTA